ncbi:alpha/beta hydrolase, partial [Intestinimonas aquisgranensis]|nr:alpha/beta hydrolase [Intestinimonas aquisgranensis]
GDLLDPNGTAVRTELATILLNFSKLTPAEETETDSEATYIAETVSIEANGRTIPAVVTLPVGEGPFPAVVLNHGHGGNKDEGTGFGGIAEALAEAGIASIRMDFPGCGDSTEPFTENTLSNMIADSNAAKDYLVANYPVDADKLGILGYSMGGRVALEIITAEDNPYKATLILSGLSTPGDEAIANILPEGMTVEDAIAVAEEKGSYDYTTQYGQNLSLSAQWFTDMLVDPLANIDNYTGPMLVIHGDKDDVVTDATNKLTVSSYPAAEELIVPDADHGYGFYSDQPDVTAMVEGSITDFFTEHLVGAVETEADAA